MLLMLNESNVFLVLYECRSIKQDFDYIVIS